MKRNTKTSKRTTSKPKLDELWLSIGGFKTVRACIAETGMADIYAGDDLYVSPCGKTSDDLICCECPVCKG